VVASGFKSHIWPAACTGIIIIVVVVVVVVVVVTVSVHAFEINMCLEQAVYSVCWFLLYYII